MKMEAEIIKICTNLLGGNSNSCGTVTTGGTESILLACLAYRNYALDNKIKDPEIILSESAHAAFKKACHYFNIKYRLVEIDPKSFEMKVNDIQPNSNTIAIIVSAPSYPHGIIDPIEEVAKIGVRYGIPVHVDACLGGFLIPFLDSAGLNKLEDCLDCLADEQYCYTVPCKGKLFMIPGITSISCDTHKYGFTPKGSSVILYRDPEYLHSQYFVATDWMGGIYPSQTLAGSRSGLNIALTWTTLMYYGMDGYIETTTEIVKVTRQIIKKIRNLGVSVAFQIMGRPLLNVIALGNVAIDNSEMFKQPYDIYELAQKMTQNGWNLNYLQNPHGFHMCITQVHASQPDFVDEFIEDLVKFDKLLKEESTTIDKPKDTTVGALYCFAQSISDQTPIVDLIVNGYLDGYYSRPEQH